MPVGMFKLCAKELGCNFIDYSARSNVVNMTWFQRSVAKMLQTFLDEETNARQVFSDKPNPDELKQYIDLS